MKKGERHQALIERVQKVNTIVDARQLAAEVGHSLGENVFSLNEIHDLWVKISTRAGWADGEETRAFLRGVALVVGSYEQALVDREVRNRLLKKVRANPVNLSALRQASAHLKSRNTQIKRALTRLTRLGLVRFQGDFHTLTASGVSVLREVSRDAR